MRCDCVGLLSVLLESAQRVRVQWGQTTAHGMAWHAHDMMPRSRLHVACPDRKRTSCNSIVFRNP